jgi:GWxTD domain-containing protein
MKRVERLPGRRPRRDHAAMPALAAVLTLAVAGGIAIAPTARAQETVPVSYQTWLTDDVVYIISNDEKNAFQALTTDEERGQFVRQFWDRRDPTPGTPGNEMKEEHYRRIAYVNEYFQGSVAGWKTDRGRTYIQYGPPDAIESYPGSRSVRPASQGRGVTETVPFEQWRYPYIEGIGRDVIIEFVDSCRCGEYRMSFDPKDRDALRMPPGTHP